MAKSDSALIRYRPDGTPDLSVSRDASFEDVVAALGDQAVDLKEQYGDGFEKLENLDTLIGRDVFIVSAYFSEGMGGEKVTVRALTLDETGRTVRYWFNNGSPTGLCGQLRLIAGPDAKGVIGLRSKNGLRVSRFHWDAKRKVIVKGLEPNAATYYLADGPQVASEEMV